MKREMFPTGQARKDEVKRKEAHIEEHGTPESIRETYQWLDSPLDGRPRIGWKFDPERDYPLYETFRDAIPRKEKSLKQYIEKTLRERKGEALGVEFGGIGGKAFSQFTPGFFKQSVAVTLADHRTGFNGEFVRQPENHTVLEGDFLKDDTYIELANVLQRERADLIIERIGGGVDFIPNEPYLAANILQKWYQMLNDRGLMLVQVPSMFRPLMHEWLKELEKHKDTLAYEFDYPTCALRIQKLDGAPEELPMLDPRLIREISLRTPIAPF